MADASRAVHWAEFRELAPDIANSAMALFAREGREPCGFLATVTAAGRPRLSPVCPIFLGHGVYVAVAQGTPKAKDLAVRGAYVLHAFLGKDDEEFQVDGRAELIMDDVHRARIQDEFPFPTFDRDVPIYELLISRALRATWVADRDPQSIKNTWKAGQV